jgi:hypothetical protein
MLKVWHGPTSACLCQSEGQTSLLCRDRRGVLPGTCAEHQITTVSSGGCRSQHKRCEHPTADGPPRARRGYVLTMIWSSKAGTMVVSSPAKLRRKAQRSVCPPASPPGADGSGLDPAVVSPAVILEPLCTSMSAISTPATMLVNEPLHSCWSSALAPDFQTRSAQSSRSDAGCRMSASCNQQRVFWRFAAARGRLGPTAMKYPAYRVNLTELSPQQMCGRNGVLITRRALKHCGSL